MATASTTSGGDILSSLPRSIRWRIQLGLLDIPPNYDETDDDNDINGATGGGGERKDSGDWEKVDYMQLMKETAIARQQKKSSSPSSPGRRRGVSSAANGTGGSSSRRSGGRRVDSSSRRAGIEVKRMSGTGGADGGGSGGGGSLRLVTSSAAAGVGGGGRTTMTTETSLPPNPPRVVKESVVDPLLGVVPPSSLPDSEGGRVVQQEESSTSRQPSLLDRDNDDYGDVDDEVGVSAAASDDDGGVAVPLSPLERLLRHNVTKLASQRARYDELAVKHYHNCSVVLSNNNNKNSDDAAPTNNKDDVNPGADTKEQHMGDPLLHDEPDDEEEGGDSMNHHEHNESSKGQMDVDFLDPLSAIANEMEEKERKEKEMDLEYRRERARRRLLGRYNVQEEESDGEENGGGGDEDEEGKGGVERGEDVYTLKETLSVIDKDLNRLQPDHHTYYHNRKHWRQRHPPVASANPAGRPSGTSSLEHGGVGGGSGGGDSSSTEDTFRQSRLDRNNMLTQILFVYAKENPALGYRQGMHEVLSYLFLVIEMDLFEEETKSFVDGTALDEDDATRKGQVQGQQPDGEEVNPASDPPPLELEESTTPPRLLHPDKLMHDAYTLFECVMSSLEAAYDVRSSTNSDGSAGKTHSSFSRSKSASSGPSPMENMATAIVTKIRDVAGDEPLYRHIINMTVPPQLYCTRWVRLMFSREVTGYRNVLQLWDAFFDLTSTAEVNGDGIQPTLTGSPHSRRKNNNSQGGRKGVPTYQHSSTALMDVLETAAASMILLIRNQLILPMPLSSSSSRTMHDANDSINILMNYPPLPDAQQLIDTLMSMMVQSRAIQHKGPSPVVDGSQQAKQRGNLRGWINKQNQQQQQQLPYNGGHQTSVGVQASAPVVAMAAAPGTVQPKQPESPRRTNSGGGGEYYRRSRAVGTSAAAETTGRQQQAQQERQQLEPNNNNSGSIINRLQISKSFRGALDAVERTCGNIAESVGKEIHILGEVIDPLSGNNSPDRLPPTTGKRTNVVDPLGGFTVSSGNASTGAVAGGSLVDDQGWTARHRGKGGGDRHPPGGQQQPRGTDGTNNATIPPVVAVTTRTTTTTKQGIIASEDGGGISQSQRPVVATAVLPTTTTAPTAQLAHVGSGKTMDKTSLNRTTLAAKLENSVSTLQAYLVAQNDDGTNNTGKNSPVRDENGPLDNKPTNTNATEAGGGYHMRNGDIPPAAEEQPKSMEAKHVVPEEIWEALADIDLVRRALLSE